MDNYNVEEALKLLDEARAHIVDAPKYLMDQIDDAMELLHGGEFQTMYMYEMGGDAPVFGWLAYEPVGELVVWQDRIVKPCQETIDSIVDANKKTKKQRQIDALKVSMAHNGISLEDLS